MRENTLFLQMPFGLVRDACQNDAAYILRLVSKLAEHHGDAMRLTPDALARDAFEETPWIHILVAEINGDVVGYRCLSR